MKRKIVFFILLLPMLIFGGEYLIPPSDPPRLVNDFAGLLTPEQSSYLEQKLVAFDDSSSTQFAVVIVNDLQGYDKADFAQRLAEQWGIGQKGKDNGGLLLLKPKTKESKGQVFIATGYGLEPYIPDAINKRIVERYMIPHFKKNDYFGGIDAGLDRIIGYVQGKFSKDDVEDEGDSASFIFFLIFMIVMFIIINRRSNNGSSTGSGRGFTSTAGPIFWGTGFGGGSFGGSSFGGGGFGGFGGGSFGGGGAGGSW